MRPRFHHQWKPDKITMERGLLAGYHPLAAAARTRGGSDSGCGARSSPLSWTADGCKAAPDGRSYGKAAGF